MSRSTVDDDELFGEAAEEIRDDVERHLANARAELPDAEAVWETDADNVLGALNGLRTALEVGDAEEHLRQAKKWYAMGERADAFEDADDLAAAIDDVEELVESLRAAGDGVGELASTLPELRGALREAHAETDGSATDGGAADADDGAETDGAEADADADETDGDAGTDLDEFEGDGAADANGDSEARAEDEE